MIQVTPLPKIKKQPPFSYNLPLYNHCISNGTVEVKYGNRSDKGTITTSGNKYTVKMKLAGTSTGTFSVIGNKLTLTEDGIEETDTFTRRS